jgi:hypothetical protein
MPALSTGGTMPAHHPCNGCVSPWADAVGTPGWQITTASRRLAVAVAIALSGRAVRSDEKGEWQARILQAVLVVVVIGADDGGLRLRFAVRPDSGVFVLAFAPWPAATVLTCPLTALPAQGQLSARDVRMTTRMGRTVRYLIPVFTPS